MLEADVGDLLRRLSPQILGDLVARTTTTPAVTRTAKARRTTSLPKTRYLEG